MFRKILAKIIDLFRILFFYTDDDKILREKVLKDYFYQIKSLVKDIYGRELNYSFYYLYYKEGKRYGFSLLFYDENDEFFIFSFSQEDYFVFSDEKNSCSYQFLSKNNILNSILKFKFKNIFEEGNIIEEYLLEDKLFFNDVFFYKEQEIIELLAGTKYNPDFKLNIEIDDDNPSNIQAVLEYLNIVSGYLIKFIFSKNGSLDIEYSQCDQIYTIEKYSIKIIKQFLNEIKYPRYYLHTDEQHKFKKEVEKKVNKINNKVKIKEIETKSFISHQTETLVVDVAIKLETINIFIKFYFDKTVEVIAGEKILKFEEYDEKQIIKFLQELQK